MREVAYAKLSDRIGRHERMNLTLKKDAIRPRGFNGLQRRIASTPWLVSSTQSRRMKRSTRSVPPNSTRTHHAATTGCPEPAYPFHDRDESQRAIASVGTRKNINLFTRADRPKGSASRKAPALPASFMHFDLGYFDLEHRPRAQKPCSRSARGCHPLGTNASGWTSQTMAERDGLPRGSDTSNKISDLLYARWLRVY